VCIGVKAITVLIPRFDRDTDTEGRCRVHDHCRFLCPGKIDHGQGWTARAA
jgi:hypothetical protein